MASLEDLMLSYILTAVLGSLFGFVGGGVAVYLYYLCRGK